MAGTHLLPAFASALLRKQRLATRFSNLRVGKSFPVTAAQLPPVYTEFLHAGRETRKEQTSRLNRRRTAGKAKGIPFSKKDLGIRHGTSKFPALLLKGSHLSPAPNAWWKG